MATHWTSGFGSSCNSKSASQRESDIAIGMRGRALCMVALERQGQDEMMRETLQRLVPAELGIFGC